RRECATSRTTLRTARPDGIQVLAPARHGQAVLRRNRQSGRGLGVIRAAFFPFFPSRAPHSAAILSSSRDGAGWHRGIGGAGARNSRSGQDLPRLPSAPAFACPFTANPTPDQRTPPELSRVKPPRYSRGSPFPLRLPRNAATA